MQRSPTVRGGVRKPAHDGDLGADAVGGFGKAVPFVREEHIVRWMDYAPPISGGEFVRCRARPTLLLAFAPGEWQESKRVKVSPTPEMTRRFRGP